MAKGAIATEFRRNETVTALDDLPGVPQGTQGQVLLVAGFTWTRYRVAFENGRDLGSIDGSHLSLAKQYDAALARRDEVTTDDAAPGEAGDGAEPGAAASAGDDKVVNGVTVPGHLLERSRRARDRLTAA